MIPIDDSVNPEFDEAMSIDEALQRFKDAALEEHQDKPAEPFDIVPEGESQLVMFKGSEIRKICHEDEWWFSIVDVVGAISQSTNPSRYWSDLKREMSKEAGGDQLYDNIVQLAMPSADGKFYKTDAATVETLLRIIQSVKSPHAEPFKRWLAKTGYERIQEIQNPELAIKRAILSYQIQGRTDDWIEKRIRSIVVRKELTNEWKKRGIEGKQYGLLTNIISQATFGGVTPEGHKRVKGLAKNHSLRDHMTDLELIFTMLGERSTQEIAKAKDAIGLSANKSAAFTGGKVAGRAREDLEQQTGQRVVSGQNFLTNKRSADPERLTHKKPD